MPEIIVDTVENDDSSCTNDSDDPEKSKIFSKIQRVKFVQTDNEIHRSGDQLSKEEAERCIEELKNIVSDFEKCTMETVASKADKIPEVSEEAVEEKAATSSKLILDLSGVASDSDDSDSLIYEYQPLTTSLSDLQGIHNHTSLIRVGSAIRHQSLESFPLHQRIKSVKKCKSLSFEDGFSVDDLKRKFESEKHFKKKVRSPKRLCEHNKLKIVDKCAPKEDRKESGKDSVSPSRVNIHAGKVAELTKHFSSLGDAGLIKFQNRPCNLKVVSDSFLNACDTSKIDAETQTSTRSAPNLSLTAAEIQSEIVNTAIESHVKLPIAKKKLTIANIRDQNLYNYDYSLIYSLGMRKAGFSLDSLLGFPAEQLLISKKPKLCASTEKVEEKRKKFPKDYIRRRKPKSQLYTTDKWSSEELISPRIVKEVEEKLPVRTSLVQMDLFGL